MRYMACFDMDGTLIEVKSSWEFIHEILGTEEEARIYRQMYERGEIDYRRWAELDVSSWRRRDFSEVLRRVDSIRLMENSERSIKMLKDSGFIVGVISSGLNVIADKICERLGMDFCKSARLLLEGNEVIGLAEDLPPDEKGSVLEEVARGYGIPLTRVAFVGDGDSDLSIFEMDLGLKIAFRPRSERIVRLADHVVHDLLEASELILRWSKGAR
ncbi:HAD-IB family phosphatase [Candidatus Korarchaeum cryptofilum]|jgi:phosphoserine phosphatase|uniref:phosphoserine phosphatase n=1 Tax=Korarchaeum cryptofilum (strain OPF8) TaxID=374847 RepID=B1L621_KORCO|nr:HAD-IB family phosphatase [Candidatus Korarchaeum cryptofilum]ACB07900.1 HAD-superfamily hydrolase, subfamily IB (PSPase-like) [Candidatus Korarchaeum cryptofilum OPF8]